MKSKFLLTMSSVLLAATLASCGVAQASSVNSQPASEGGNSSVVPSEDSNKGNSDQDPDGSEPDVIDSKEPEVSDPNVPEVASDWLEKFSEKLAEGNFTADAGDDTYGDWLTVFGISNEAFVVDYVPAAEKEGAADYGVIIHDGAVYSFGIDANGLSGFKAVYELTEEDDDAIVYDFDYTPMDLLAVEWEDKGDGEYSTDDADFKAIFSILCGWGSDSAQYFSDITMVIEDTYDRATLTGSVETEDGIVTAEIKIGSIGKTKIQAVEDWLADPVIPQADKDYVGLFQTAIEGENFTAVASEAGDEWCTFYGFGPDAFYIDYSATAESQYEAEDYGYLIYDEALYSFSIEGNALANFKLLDDGTEKPWTDVNDAVYGPMDLAAADYSFVDGSTFTTDDTYAKAAILVLNGYKYSYASQLGDVEATFNDAGDEAIFASSIASGIMQVEVKNLGSTTNAVIDAYLANPVAPTLELTWPAEDVAAIVDALAPGSETVLPVLETYEDFSVDSGAEKAAENGYGMLTIDTDDDSLVGTYEAALVAAGWVDTPEGFLSPEGDILVTCDFINYYNLFTYFEIVISGYEAPSEAWPAEEVAALLGDSVTDVALAFNGENSGFRFLEEDAAIRVFVAKGQEEALLAAYNAALADANWTLQADGSYLSPNEQIFVLASVETDGAILIEFASNPWLEAVLALPLDVINAALGELGFEFTLPESFALTDPEESGFLVNYETETLYPNVGVGVKGNALDAWVAAIEAIVKANGFALEEEHSDETFFCYYNETTGQEVDVLYDAAQDATYVMFFE